MQGNNRWDFEDCNTPHSCLYSGRILHLYRSPPDQPACFRALTIGSERAADSHHLLLEVHCLHRHRLGRFSSWEQQEPQVL